MLMMMDTHFSQKEETRKIKTGRKREKETRAKSDVMRICSFARGRKESGVLLSLLFVPFL